MDILHCPFTYKTGRKKIKDLNMIDSSAFQGKKAAYYTLGCKLNFSETSTFAKMLEQMGVTPAKQGEQADICLINTCSVTEVADHKCRQAIHRMARSNPGAFIIVTGCYAQLKAETVASIDGVDLVLGSDEKANLIQYLSQAWEERDNTTAEINESTIKSKAKDLTPDSDRDAIKAKASESPGKGEISEISAKGDIVENSGKGEVSKQGQFFAKKTKNIRSFAPSCSRGNRTRYFLKVQDGCDYFCTYCTIPFARGFSRSPSIASLVEQARQAAAEGGKEIVLTGVNIGDFGKNTGETFLDLVKALDQVEEIARYRISSLEPDLLSDELIAYCAQSRAFMPHFHIPLQSGSDEVLRLMHRRYDTALFAHKIHLIKKYMPDAFIGVDVMTGTRGETPELFEETFQFLKNLDVSQLHVFPYSERPGTAALKIPYKVNDKDKKERCHRLLTLSDEKTKAFYSSFIGQTRTVLFEKAPKGKAMHGFTDNYIRVELPPAIADPALDNELTTVTLGNFNAKGDALRVEN